jgi:hypothetical protein
VKFSITSAKLTGNPAGAGWAQIHEFKPEDKEKLKLRGHLFAVISTQTKKEGVESVAIGRELLARLHEEYFGDTKLTPFNAIKKAVERVIDEFSEEIGGIEIAAAAFVEDIVYSAAGGGARVLIFRDAMLATILASEKGMVISASGHPKEGDLLLLGSSKFFDEIGRGVLRAALEGKNPEEATESFAPMVHSKKDSGSMGLAIIKFEKEGMLPAFEIDKSEEKKVSPKVSKAFFPSFSFFDQIKIFLKKLPDRKIYVRRQEINVEESQKKKQAVSIGVILLLLLVVSIVFGIRQAKIKQEKKRYETKINKARHNLEEARKLFSLNPDRARELFSESARIVQELEAEKVKDKEIVSIRKALEEGKESVLGEYDVVTDQFLDLSLIEGFEASSLFSGADKMFVLDKKRKRVAEIVIETKKTEIVAGPAQIDNPKAIVSYANRVFVLEDDGVYEVGDKKERMIEKDWGEDTLIYAYAGNLYILDKEVSKIWRYPGILSGFGDQADWLAPGIEPDLSKVVSWSIDGSIWILTSTGKIEKYTLGSPMALGKMAVSPPLQNPLAIYTNEELNFVYLLDPATKRVVVFDKEGNYKAQYKSDILSEAIGLAVSEKEGKIIILTKNKLYSIEIKHSF